MNKKWEITKQHKEQIPEWNERWINIITNTNPIDFRKTSEAVLGMYEAANLEKPHIVYVPSVFVGVAVYFAAEYYWLAVANTRAATDAATCAATIAATDVATIAATDVATYAATRATTYAATRAATAAATRAATRAATTAATTAATDAATDAATSTTTNTPTQTLQECIPIAANVVANKLNCDSQLVESYIRKNCFKWHSPYNGGSEWASWCAYLSFVRDIVGWKHPSHKNYAHYENAAIYGGPRFIHHNFCILCDRPEVRRTQDSKLHSVYEPAIVWRCGSRISYIQGLLVTSPLYSTSECEWFMSNNDLYVKSNSESFVFIENNNPLRELLNERPKQNPPNPS